MRKKERLHPFVCAVIFPKKRKSSAIVSPEAHLIPPFSPGAVFAGCRVKHGMAGVSAPSIKAPQNYYLLL